MKQQISKQFKSYEVKNLSLEVKDIDTVGRRVKIALSAFNNIDSDRDVIRKGAFAKSIQERGASSTSNRKIAHLRYHDWEHQIGKFISLEETDTHLIGVSDLGRSTKGNDAFLDYQDGIIREHSIGFNYIPDKMQLIGEGDTAYFEIKELILWEGSAVTFGANSLTPTLDVSKGLTHEAKEEMLKKINEDMTAFITALKNGKGTDERLYCIEMGLKVCQQKYNSLINFVPVVKTTEIEQPNQSVKAEDTKITEAQKFYLSLLK
jgi:HK97 family phage prohead protease